MQNVTEPLKSQLVKDNDFTVNVAKVVNARIRHDRYNVINSIAESELEVPQSAAPKLDGDLSKEQMATVDSVMSSKFGDKWFKDRRTHPSNIPTNVHLQCSIVCPFYEGNAEMITLLEKEVAQASVIGDRLDVNAEVLSEFLASSDGIRTGAWGQVEPFYTLTRERLQRKVRSQRHREKKKIEILFESSEESGDDSRISLKSSVAPQIHELREDKSIPPLKSVNQCVKDMVNLVKFLSDGNKRTTDKKNRLVTMFEKLAVEMERRIGIKVVNQDAEFCFILGLLTAIDEILPVDQNRSDRLQKMRKDLSAQSSVVLDEPTNVHKSRREEIKLFLDDQKEVVGEFVKRWTEDEESAFVISSAQLEARARDLVEKGTKIIQELDEVITALTQQDVLWILGRVSLWYARSCILSSTSYNGSSLTRIGHCVRIVTGILKYMTHYFNFGHRLAQEPFAQKQQSFSPPTNKSSHGSSSKHRWKGKEPRRRPGPDS